MYVTTQLWKLPFRVSRLLHIEHVNVNMNRLEMLLAHPYGNLYNHKFWGEKGEKKKREKFK